MQIKNHIDGIPPRILMDPHSFWIGKRNHKKLLHFLARPIIGPGLQTPNKKTTNHTWAPPETAKGPKINTRKGHAFRTRARARLVTTIHTVRKHQYCLLQYSGFFRKNLYIPSKGNKYILVAYHHDSNIIHANRLKTISGLD